MAVWGIRMRASSLNHWKRACESVTRTHTHRRVRQTRYVARVHTHTHTGLTLGDTVLTRSPQRARARRLGATHAACGSRARCGQLVLGLTVRPLHGHGRQTPCVRRGRGATALLLCAAAACCAVLSAGSLARCARDLQAVRRGKAVSVEVARNLLHLSGTGPPPFLPHAVC